MGEATGRSLAQFVHIPAFVSSPISSLWVRCQGPGLFGVTSLAALACRDEVKTENSKRSLSHPLQLAVGDTGHQTFVCKWTITTGYHW